MHPGRQTVATSAHLRRATGDVAAPVLRRAGQPPDAAVRGVTEAPLTTFEYTWPTGPGPAGRLDRIETDFDAGGLIDLRTSKRGLPKMALKVNLLWGYDPATKHLSVPGADATLGIVPGLSISGGLYRDIQRPPNLLPGPDGGTVESKLSLPAGAGPMPIPDARIMINVDLLKFNPPDLKRQLKSWF